MKTKAITLFVVLIMVCCLVFAFAACAAKNQGETPNTDGENPGDTDVTDPNTKDPTQTALVPRYHVSFYTGEAATQVSATAEKSAGAEFLKPADPMLARSIFEGWYTDYGTWQNKYEFSSRPIKNEQGEIIDYEYYSTMPTNNLVLYAKWSESVSDDYLKQYEDNLDANSQNGHLYIHYLRFDNNPSSYEKLNLWVWPKAFTGKSFEWNHSGSTITVDDVGGAVCDIDLTKLYDGAGNDGDETLQFFKTGYCNSDYKPEYINDESTYMDSQIGFLIVYKDSKDKGSHWTSDGGNQYFSIKEEGILRKNGSIHIFAVQDNVGDFKPTVVDRTEITNPYENDDGTRVSVCNVDSSEKLPKVADVGVLTETVTGVGYQIMVASYADSDGDGYGDIRGIINNLDYIESLNVDNLWLTPIQLSDSYHGYDIIDYKAIDPKFGTDNDYKELLTKCHEKGIKVIMDLVLNHTSINNKWFQNSAKMIEEDGIDYRSFYHWKNHDTTALSADWYAYSEYAYSYYAKFASSMPELNYDYQGTRDAILDVAKHWLNFLGDKKGVDGFRIDAVKHIYMADEVEPKSTDIVIEDYDAAAKISYSSNVTKNLNFFSWFISALKVDYENCYIVGENFDGQAFNVAPYYTALDGMLDFYSYYELGKLGIYPDAADSLAGGNTSSDGSTPKGKNTDQLKGGEWDIESILNTNASYGGSIISSMFSSNHDIPRLMNNVERVVNGAEWSAGTITAANAQEGERRSMAVLSTMLMMPGVSWIYYGDELAMSSNYGEGETKNSGHVDRQYRQPFKWTTNEEDSKYTTSYSISGDKTYYVKWDSYNALLKGAAEQAADPQSFLNEVKSWTKLKSEDEVLRYGSYKYKEAKWPGSSKQFRLFSFERSYNGVTYWVITNFSSDEYTNMKELYGSNVELVQVSGGNMDKLPAGGTVVLKMK